MLLQIHMNLNLRESSVFRNTDEEMASEPEGAEGDWEPWGGSEPSSSSRSRLIQQGAECTPGNN